MKTRINQTRVHVTTQSHESYSTNEQPGDLKGDSGACSATNRIASQTCLRNMHSFAESAPLV